MTALPSMTPKHTNASVSTAITRTKKRGNRPQPLRWSMTPHSKIPQSFLPFLDMHLIEANLLDDGGRKHKRQEILNTFKHTRALRSAQSS